MSAVLGSNIAVDANIEYRKPPVVERVASLYADVSEDLFERRFEDWRNMVAGEFPVYEPLKQWNLNFEQRGDPKEPIPILKSSAPELIITPRFSRRHSNEGFDWSIRCPRGQFTMNMHPDPSDGSGRRYAQLRHEFLHWAERWLKHFDISNVNILQLLYVNALNKNTAAPFFTHDGTRLALAEIINVFVNIGRSGEVMTPPFACLANIVFPGMDNASLTLQVQDMSSSLTDPAVNINFVVNVRLDAGQSSVEKIAELLDWAHDRIVDRFDLVFSQKAKSSFQPVIK
jgi:hypothetical protein